MSLSENEISDKSRMSAFAWGLLGCHRFYTAQIVSGIIFLCTLGGFGIWWLIDLIKIVSGSYKDKYGKFIHVWKAEKNTFVPLGVFSLALLVRALNHRPDAKEQKQTLNKPSMYSVGTVIHFSDIDYTVIKVEVKDTVGSEYINLKASEGGVYVAVQFKYKNTTTKPLSAFRSPSIKLIDSSGTEYSPDVDASSSYSMEFERDTKIISDLNPGITVKGSSVFEISRESLKKNTWTLRIHYLDDADVPISL